MTCRTALYVLRLDRPQATAGFGERKMKFGVDICKRIGIVAT